MNTKGYLINEQTDGLIPVSVELVRTKDRLHVRMPDQSVVISLDAEDVRKMFTGRKTFEGSGQP